MVDCVTNERLEGIINSDNPSQVWWDHINVCAPHVADDAAVWGMSGSEVTITEESDGRFHITSDDSGHVGFILEVCLSQAQATALCDAMGWVY